MSSIYHIIDRIPCFEAEGMYHEYEELANLLVESGQLRVDTGGKCNFARWVDAGKNVSLMISKEQLEGDLLKETISRLEKIYNSPKKVQSIIDNCNAQIAKHIPIEKDLRLKLARILVQSTHSIVMRWLLLEKVEAFVSYSYNIGDMMDVQTWQTSGSNSGMQSTDGRDVAVYVSAGGDPLAPTDPKLTTQGDGWPAVARMQIIAGQELGHYSDIKRNNSGHQIGRHSANFSCTRATPHVKAGRVNDLKGCDAVRDQLIKHGLSNLLHHESSLKFYNRNKLRNMRSLYHKVMCLIYRKKLLKLAKNPDWLFVRKFDSEQYMGLMLDAMIEDMKFNLAPVADVYKRDDKEAEIAIACVEALARVPQQANKWGHITTSVMMKNLYIVYYQEVIPDLIKIYENITGSPYKPNLNRIPVSFKSKLKKLFAKKDLPYRDLEN